MGKYEENMSNSKLIRDILIQSIFIILGTYYIPKIVYVVPFIFQYGEINFLNQNFDRDLINVFNYDLK